MVSARIVIRTGLEEEHARDLAGGVVAVVEAVEAIESIEVIDILGVCQSTYFAPVLGSTDRDLQRPRQTS